MPKRVLRTPLHPGEILREQFMADFGVSINRLARDLRVPPTLRVRATGIGEIVHGRRSITPDTALRLARYFGTTPEFWINLQSAYDLDVARASLPQIEADVRPIVAA
jgi:addiction module HigA family antidote